VRVGCSQVEMFYIIDIEWVRVNDWRPVWQTLDRPGPLLNADEYRQSGCADIDEATAYYFGNERVDRWSRRDFVVAAQNCWSWTCGVVVMKVCSMKERRYVCEAQGGGMVWCGFLSYGICEGGNRLMSPRQDFGRRYQKRT
jgi:hypothetical protein